MSNPMVPTYDPPILTTTEACTPLLPNTSPTSHCQETTLASLLLQEIHRRERAIQSYEPELFYKKQYRYLTTKLYGVQEPEIEIAEKATLYPLGKGSLDIESFLRKRLFSTLQSDNSSEYGYVKVRGIKPSTIL